MRRGLFVPPFGELADARLLAELGRRAEQAGWEALFVWDHVQYRAPAVEVLDPWVAMAAIGVATERIRLGAMVTPLARRRPWIVARQLAALDRLTGGRMVLGVGLGLDQSGAEWSTFAEEADLRRRAAMLDEALEVVHGLLSGERLSFDGTHYHVEGARFRPTPLQSPLPTWVAARYPNRAPLRRAVRYEGVFVIDLHTPAELADVVAAVGELRALSGFDVVVAPEAGAAPASEWAEAGATWVLEAFSPFDIRSSDVFARADAGP